MIGLVTLLVFGLGVPLGEAQDASATDLAAQAALRDALLQAAEKAAIRGDVAGLDHAVTLCEQAEALATEDSAEFERIRARRHALADDLLAHPGVTPAIVQRHCVKLFAESPAEEKYLARLLDTLGPEWSEIFKRNLLLAQKQLRDRQAKAAVETMRGLFPNGTPSRIPGALDAVLTILEADAIDEWALAEMALAIRDRDAGDPIAALRRLTEFTHALGDEGARTAHPALFSLVRVLKSELGIDVPGEIPDWATPLDPFSAGFEFVGTNAQGFREFRRPRDGMTMIAVPYGPFTMGTDAGLAGPDCRPSRTVRLSGFLIDKFEISNAMYAAFLNAAAPTGLDEAGHLLLGEHDLGLVRRDNQWRCAGAADAPVVGVTWFGARAYAQWVGCDLPTDAQWERAARGTDGRLFPWGNEWPVEAGDLAAFDATTAGMPVAVGRFARGASAVGALDMAGNAWEWCRDALNSGATSGGSTLLTDPQSSRGQHRVTRGGSCRSAIDELYAFARSSDLPGSAFGNLGFRCAFDAGAPPVPGPQTLLDAGARVSQFPPVDVAGIAPTELAPEFAKVLRPLGTNAHGFEIFERTTDGARVVKVPAGRFWMGDVLGVGRANEGPARWLWVPEFFLDVDEITNGRFATFLNAAKHVSGHLAGFYAIDHPAAQIGFDGREFAALPGCENLPVTLVSFSGASAYSLWAWGKDPASYGADACLPTAAQWERAAAWNLADGRKFQFPWGDEIPAMPGFADAGRLVRANFARAFEGEAPRWACLPVLAVDHADAAADESPVGARQMAGNVREWTVNAYLPKPYLDVLPTQPDPTVRVHLLHPGVAVDPMDFGRRGANAANRLAAANAGPVRREVRGGSWRSRIPADVRAIARGAESPIAMADDLGFRTAIVSRMGPATDPQHLAPSISSANPSVTVPNAGGSEGAFTPATLTELTERTPQGFRQFRRESDGAVMIEIPAGTLRMGHGTGDAGPVHDVPLSAFLIDKHEITNEQFAKFLTAYGQDTVKNGPHAGKPLIFLTGSAIASRQRGAQLEFIAARGSERLPVVMVTWFGAAEYARWAGVILPSEAQWEMAARGAIKATGNGENGGETSGGPFPWGDAAATAERAIFGQTGRGARAQAVGNRAAGASPFGVEDLAGNVWEWVQDWYSPTFYADADRATRRDAISGYPTDRRVNRGGGFRSSAAWLRVFARAADHPEMAYDSLGFRCAGPIQFATGTPDPQVPEQSEAH